MPRRLILQVNTSLDGCIAGPGNTLDFVFSSMPWSDDINAYIDNLLSSVDEILLGRGLAEGFTPAWRNQPDRPGADRMNAATKVVFTTTLDTNPWNGNTRLVKVESTNDIRAKIQKMKATEGKDLIAYGGVQFARTLVEEGLVDEMCLVMNPWVLPEGKKLFAKETSMKLIDAKGFDCGVAVLKYSL